MCCKNTRESQSGIVENSQLSRRHTIVRLMKYTAVEALRVLGAWTLIPTLPDYPTLRRVASANAGLFAPRDPYCIVARNTAISGSRGENVARAASRESGGTRGEKTFTFERGVSSREALLPR